MQRYATIFNDIQNMTGKTAFTIQKSLNIVGYCWISCDIARISSGIVSKVRVRYRWKSFDIVGCLLVIVPENARRGWKVVVCSLEYRQISLHIVSYLSNILDYRSISLYIVGISFDIVGHLLISLEYCLVLLNIVGYRMMSLGYCWNIVVIIRHQIFQN